MNQSKIINLLNRVLNNSGRKLKKQSEWMYWSPFIFHHKPKLQINVDTGKWHCWVSNQGGRNLFQLLKKVRATREHFNELSELTEDTPRYLVKEKKEDVLNLPESFKPLWNGGDSIVKRHALNYLQSRGITEEDLLKYNIGYCDEGKYSNRIIIPSYDSDGKLNFYVGRDFYSSTLKYLNSFTSKNVIGFDLFINWSEPIILCEGVFDAIAFKRNAIPLFGKTVSKKLEKKIIEYQVKTIYLALDNDAIKDSIKITQKFINEGITVKTIMLKEKDPSEIGFKKLLQKIKNTESTNFTDLIKFKLKGF